MEDSTKAFIARNKLRLFVGSAFVGLVLSFLSYETFAKVWADTFSYYGIPPLLVYILGPVFIFLGCWFVGYEYEIQRLWAYEVSHQNKNINPEFVKVCEDIEKIKKVLGIEE